jgi:hypothetical protein
MGDRKRAEEEEDAPDSVSSAPESGQPPGGREPSEPFTRRRESPTPRSGEAGEDRGDERWQAADGSDADPGSAPARRTLSRQKDDD